MDTKNFGISFTVTTSLTEDELLSIVDHALDSNGIKHGPVVSSRRGIRGRRKKETPKALCELHGKGIVHDKEPQTPQTILVSTSDLT